MSFIVWSGILSLGYFLALLLMVELGRLRGQARLAVDPKHALAGTGAIEGPVLGLYGLLIAFSFGGAISRFDERRNLVIEEANIVQTAWFRMDVLPAADQPAIRGAFKTYLERRFAGYQHSGEDEEGARIEAQVRAAKEDLWSKVIAVYKRDGFSSPGNFLMASLNDMFDIGQKRINVRQKHTPVLIYAMMAGMGLAAAKKLNWLYAVGFALINALTVHFIVDLEFPRHGMIRVDAIDRVLEELLKRIQ